MNNWTNGELKEEGLVTKARRAFLKLQKMGVPVKIDIQGHGGHFWINAEEHGAESHLDYYDLYWGSEKLQKVLSDNDLYFEWVNAAAASVYDS